MKKPSRTVPRRRQSVSPTPRHLPLVDILIDTQAELQELVVASGLKVLEAMLEEDRAAVCGPRYAHQPARQAYRTGHTPSQVVLGGRKVAIRRPRARRAGEEVPLPTARAFANADPLNRRVVDQLLIGVATRQYARSLDPLGADVTTRGTSKSAVSRRFVAQTQAQLDAWRATNRLSRRFWPGCRLTCMRSSVGAPTLLPWFNSWFHSWSTTASSLYAARRRQTRLETSGLSHSFGRQPWQRRLPRRPP